MYKYKNGDSVSYDMGILKGNAVVVGVSSTPLPWIGATYILKDPKMNTDSYPYECFVCPENMMSDYLSNPSIVTPPVSPPPPPPDRLLIEGQEPVKPHSFEF